LVIEARVVENPRIGVFTSRGTPTPQYAYKEAFNGTNG
jgi:hypothetical protein